jgi:antitoxin (DNA-binding transcriptional repressor) of toxin-antitoxin stability system
MFYNAKDVTDGAWKEQIGVALSSDLRTWTRSRAMSNNDLDEVVTSDYFSLMRAVNIKELKARLSSYIQQVRGGETFLVTDRNHVVARLGPVEQSSGKAESEMAARLAAIGARPPMRGRRPTDYSRPGRPVDLTTATIDSLLDWARGESAGQGEE